MPRLPKRYPRRKTHPALMGCGGRGKPTTVINQGRVMDYVGIGWIIIGDAEPEDYFKYPELTDDDETQRRPRVQRPARARR